MIDLELYSQFETVEIILYENNDKRIICYEF